MTIQVLCPYLLKIINVSSVFVKSVPLLNIVFIRFYFSLNLFFPLLVFSFLSIVFYSPTLKISLSNVEKKTTTNDKYYSFGIIIFNRYRGRV
jgi:hypothetical protein